ncbi:MAG: ATP-binding protein [Phycisphaerales bacterium]
MHPTATEPVPEPAEDGMVRAGARPRRRGFLTGMRVRKKVLILHTLFSIGLAAILLVPLRPAITEVVEQAEISEARVLLRLAMAQGAEGAPFESLAPEASLRRAADPASLGIVEGAVSQARAAPGRPVTTFLESREPAAVAYIPGAGGGEFWLMRVSIPEARRAVLRLYALTAIALLAFFGLVAAALELFVLPQHVYDPIGRMLEADRAVQGGEKARELIAESAIPADELGEIMRSRNRTIVALRRHERALAEALEELGRVAGDLKRKNHLLEAARRNLADADRLASFGVMSAGIAHELNTPLAVVKGLAEKLNADPARRLQPVEAALMLRVVRRLERLGESLLDLARVRPPETRPTLVRALVEEAGTLVRLDRGAASIELANAVPEDLSLECDADRMIQVLVNLLRNSVDAIRSARPGPGRVEVAAEVSTKDGREWVSITVADDGPGIDPEVLSRLFEPFVSRRLDAQGTGLGLAVSEGIIREHGGVLVARNRADGPGAVFEVLMPVRAVPYAAAGAAAGAPDELGDGAGGNGQG